MKKVDTNAVAAAGEYLVASELSKRGYIVSVTPKNTKSVDLLCSNADITKTVGIQVKTNSGSKREWKLKEKDENLSSESLFYVFVNLNNGKKLPDFSIVPSKTVAKYIKKSHKKWLKTPGKRVKTHKNTDIRQFDDPKEKYLNRWDLLGL